MESDPFYKKLKRDPNVTKRFSEKEAGYFIYIGCMLNYDLLDKKIKNKENKKMRYSTGNL